MNTQRLLLLRLRIKQNKKRITDAVDENFGYCPQGKWFDELLEDNRKDEAEFKLINNKDR